MTEWVARYEFDRLAARVDAIDSTGTRGVAVLAVQVQELAKDFARHEQKHDQVEADRKGNRKWLFMALIAAIAAIDGPVVTVMLARGH